MLECHLAIGCATKTGGSPNIQPPIGGGIGIGCGRRVPRYEAAWNGGIGKDVHDEC